MDHLIDLLYKFTKQTNPRLVTSGGIELHVKHVFESSAESGDLDHFSNSLKGTSLELLELYRRSDGARLLARVDDEHDCFYFIPIDEMAREKKELEEWMTIGIEPEDYNEEVGDDFPLTIHGIPTWWESAIVFAGIGYAPERFYLAVEGEHSGKVFIFEHDGGYSELVCNHIGDFIKMICEDTANFCDKYVSMSEEIVEYKFDGS